ncbi:DUF2690 domain-containing protein [Micromonospora inyonensis]|uniref:DUF2690 domain-containing protein n=1 Tax=Micromonospora inyonensis TaxID=47866 RepID=UPI000B808A9D|nr:DUF2690 domain-containing protein [Micromonospora inyonensis]
MSCNGKDPVALGCSTATTVDYVTAKNGVFIELRYSSACQAYWTRYTNYPGSTGEARIKSTIGSTVYRKTLAGYAGEEGWTPMMAANQSPEACLFFYDSSAGRPGPRLRDPADRVAGSLHVAAVRDRTAWDGSTPIRPAPTSTAGDRGVEQLEGP